MFESKFKKRSYRKKASEITDEIEAVKEAEAVETTPEAELEQRELDKLSLPEKLEALKMIQQMRQKAKGLNGEKLLSIPAEVAKETMAQAPTAAKAYRANDDDDDDVQTRNLNLVETFQSKKEETPVDKIMEEYINKEILKKKGLYKEEQAEQPVQQLNPGEDDGQMKVLEKAAESKDTLLTGIPEVQLPVTYKMKNIEETERARLILLQKEKDNAHLFTLDNMKSEYGTKRPGQPLATDDLAIGRFKKRMAHKW